MTREEFTALPYLLTPGQVEACGYAPRTVDKYAESGILAVILPAGCRKRRFQKRQLAQMLGWESTVDRAAWAREKPLLPLGVVQQWTGYDERTVANMVLAGGLVVVRPAGLWCAKYRKEQIGEWIGL